jgi:hypothetical protein
MKLSSRESILFLVTFAVVFFCGSFFFVGPKIDEWKSVYRDCKSASAKIESYKRLVAQRHEWQEKFNVLSSHLPQYPADKNLDVHWKGVMDRLAIKHNVKILEHKAGQEKQDGEVYELPIECRRWEGDLESIAHFLFDLQSEGAMLDVRFLRIRVGKGVLRGAFSLYCAYTRENGPED